MDVVCVRIYARQEEEATKKGDDRRQYAAPYLPSSDCARVSLRAPRYEVLYGLIIRLHKSHNYTGSDQCYLGDAYLLLTLHTTSTPTSILVEAILEFVKDNVPAYGCECGFSQKFPACLELCSWSSSSRLLQVLSSRVLLKRFPFAGNSSFSDYLR